MRDCDGRWTASEDYPESSDLCSELRVHASRTDSGRVRLVTVYRGIRFRCYPESGHRYFEGYVGDTYTGLHHYAYECEIGPVPDGWHVHHKDHDPQNNRRDNLVCLPA